MSLGKIITTVIGKNGGKFTVETMKCGALTRKIITKPDGTKMFSAIYRRDKQFLATVKTNNGTIKKNILDIGYGIKAVDTSVAGKAQFGPTAHRIISNVPGAVPGYRLDAFNERQVFGEKAQAVYGQLMKRVLNINA